MKSYSIIFALAMMVAAGVRGEMATGTITSSTTELVGGTVYTVQGNVPITGARYKSGLSVKKGSGGTADRVIINIPKDCSLTVKGSDGIGYSAGCAGIALPADMTLYITGEGSLTATGGAAADGANSLRGEDAYYSDDGDNHHRNGSGGDAGIGGGGAGAGIGGNGGNGGSSGGFGAPHHSDYQYSYHDRNFPKDGDNGGNGDKGDSGVVGGTVYILGDVSVTVTGGAAGKAGTSSTTYGTYTVEDASDDWLAGGGGPGGCGGGGGAAQAIGGGGGGGGCGGGGGSGSYVVVDDHNDPNNLNLIDKTKIRGGKGGVGGGGKIGGKGGKEDAQYVGTDGEAGKTAKNFDENNKDQSKAGDGGKGGDGGEQGASGGLYVLPSVGLSISPYRASDALTAQAFVNFFEVDVTLDMGLKNAGGTAVTTTVKQPFAYAFTALDDLEINGVNPRIKRPGYRFAGFWTTAEGDGTCVYGPDYKPTMVLSPYTQDFTLYARWEVDPSILSVTSSGDGASTLGVYGNTVITLRDAVNALIDNPLLVGEDGRRRVTFEKLDATNRIIRLAGEIVIPAGARSFEINGLCELVPGEKGVEIVASANSRHFNFRGKTSDNGGMFTFANLNFKGGNPSGGGGSILASGANVYVDNCSFIGNSTTGYGGAINLEASSTNYLLVVSTTFARNSAGHGGAVRLAGNGNAALFVNTTFSGNVASGHGGAINAINGQEVGLLACTFTGNAAGNDSKGPTLSVSTPVKAVNCIFTGNEPQFQGSLDKITTYWCSTGVSPSEAFVSGGSPIMQAVAGVTHVIHPPLGGANAGNEDAAEIYSDPSYENVRAVGRDGTSVTLAGHPDLAKIPFVIDQLAAVRTAPTRGAVRLAVGTEPVTVELDGVLYDEGGNPKSNQLVNAEVTVSYSDGEATPTNVVIKTAEYGVFGLSVPVDGSDGLSHNVTAVKVDALGPDPIAVTMAPYALTAASVELLGSNDYLPLYGDAIAIGNVAAGSISVTNSFDARAATSFTAGSLKGFGKIDLEHVDVSGGTLDWLGGENPQTTRGDVFADLASMSVGGGADAQNVGTISGGKVSTWEAKNDGFFQLQAQCQNPTNTTLRIELLAPGNVVAAEVTPEGTLGDSSDARRFIWTIPVRKDDTVRLMLSAGELTLVKGQFIYFGVAE